MSPVTATVLRGTFKDEEGARISGAQNDLDSAQKRIANADRALRDAQREQWAAASELSRAKARLSKVVIRQKEEE